MRGRGGEGELPADPSLAAMPGATQAELVCNRKEDGLPKKVVIAVVDDDVPLREALTSLLGSLGYGAVTFERAEDLLNSKRRWPRWCPLTGPLQIRHAGAEASRQASCPPLQMR